MVAGFQKRVQVEDVPVNAVMERKIAEGRSTITEDELPMISIAVECVTIYDTEKGGLPQPIWVAIVNHRSEVIYETLIKQKGVRMVHTELHGLELKDLKCAMHAPAAKLQILKFLVSAKTIVGSGVYNHLTNIGFTPDDVKDFMPKMRDVSMYFTPYEKRSCNLAAISFLRFGKEVITLDKHSPVMSARVAMKLYLSDRDMFEATARRLDGISHRSLPRMKPNNDIIEELRIKTLKKEVDGKEFWPSSYITALDDKYPIKLPKYSAFNKNCY